MKKKIIFLVSVLIIVSFFYLAQRTDAFENLKREYIYYSVCSEPILYKEGSIDPRFGLTRRDVVNASKEGANIWNSAAGFEVFSYSEDAELEINMVYDQRQSMDTAIRSLENDLETGRTTLDQEVANYKARIAEFDRKSAEFSRRVDEWNQKQGGTQEEYDALLNEQNALEKEADELNLLAQSLNFSTSEYNTQVGEFNKSIDTFNKVLEEKPEEGLYDPFLYEIDIYFLNDRDKLVRTIAHELGHARGLGHTNDERDIMYPITTSVLELSEKDIELLKEVCEPYPIYEPYLNNVKNNIEYIKVRYFSN